MSKIFLIRHGETDMNKLGIVQGSGVDSSLNETGRAQAEAFFNAYNYIDFQLVITSALKRTAETVSHFLAKGIPNQQFAEINEMGWGDHEGKPGTPKMRADYLRARDAWLAGNFDARVQGGESINELRNRLNRFLDYLKNIPESPTLICSHGRSICALVCLMKGEPLTEMKNYRTKNTGLYIAERKGDYYNFEIESDITHLATETKISGLVKVQK